MNASKNPELSVIVPVHNERESVAHLYQEIIDVVKPLQCEYEILFVDDGSSDGTIKELRKLKGITLLVLKKNFGKSQALQAGFDHAQGKYIITMDGDLQDDPKEIPRFLEAAKQGYFLGCGWKKLRLDPLSKRIPSKLANVVTRNMSDASVHDMNCGYKLYRREVAKSLALYGDMHRYIPALVAAMGFPITEIVVNHRSRTFGKSKYGAWRLANGLFDFSTLVLLRKFMDRPMHFFGAIGYTLLGLGITSGVIAVGMKVAQYRDFVQTPLPALSALLIIIGVQMLAMGILAEVLMRVYYESQGKRPYEIADVVEQ